MAGNPVEHLTVRCHSAARPLHGSTQSVRTKKDGSFAFFVPPGRAYVYTSNTIDGRNKGAKYAGADATIDVSNNWHPDAFTLRLAQSTEPIGSMKWVKETTPGTKVLRQKLADDVTGTVVDTNGDPVENVEVFIHGASASRTDSSGKFRVKSSRASQFLMYAFKSGYRIWMGKPTSGRCPKDRLGAESPATRRAFAGRAAEGIRNSQGWKCVYAGSRPGYATLAIR